MDQKMLEQCPTVTQTPTQMLTRFHITTSNISWKFHLLAAQNDNLATQNSNLFTMRNVNRFLQSLLSKSQH